MPIIQNIAAHDFHLPMIPDLARREGESKEDHDARVQAATSRREGESNAAYDARMASQAILVPKSRPEKGDEGEPGYDPGGPGEVTVTDAQLEAMRKHRVARRWFGLDLRKGQGLIVKEGSDGASKMKGKAA